MVNRKWSCTVMSLYFYIIQYSVFHQTTESDNCTYVQRRLKRLLQFLYSLFTLSYFILFKWIFILFFKMSDDSDANKRKRLSSFQ